MLTYAKIKAPRAARPATAIEPETELAAPVNAGAYGDETFFGGLYGAAVPAGAT